MTDFSKLADHQRIQNMGPDELSEYADEIEEFALGMDRGARRDRILEAATRMRRKATRDRFLGKTDRTTWSVVQKALARAEKKGEAYSVTMSPDQVDAFADELDEHASSLPQGSRRDMMTKGARDLREGAARCREDGGTMSFELMKQPSELLH